MRASEGRGLFWRHDEHGALDGAPWQAATCSSDEHGGGNSWTLIRL